MAFTGKATYSAGTTLPELAEDVSDLIGIVSPYETPLLDALGDPLRAATSTHHEWLEDELLPNKDSIDDSSISSPSTETDFDVANGSRFRVGEEPGEIHGINFRKQIFLSFWLVSLCGFQRDLQLLKLVFHLDNPVKQGLIVMLLRLCL